jgi:hypothetical protein
MKKIVATLLLFTSFIGYSQTNGITYQAVIINPSGEELPGINNTNAPLANKNICLKFSILDQNSQFEYIETVQTTTDEYGMVNLIIGTGVRIGGYASSFANIVWNANPKSLKVDVSTTGECSYYTEISNQPFTAVPFALFAVNSESTAALTALQTTVAANATATTAALALKENAINKSTTTTLGTSDLLFPTQKAVKTYVDTNISTVNATVTANATNATNAIAAVQADVNQNEADSDAADVVLQNNITTLQNTVTSNAAATTAALGLKEDAANKSTTTTLGTSNVLFPTQNAVKTYVDTNISTVNASNTVLQATVTANAAATTNALGLKEDAINKSTTTTLGTSDLLFPTQNAVKTYVDTNITSINASNTALQSTVTANATATTAALALKEDAANKSTTTTLGTSDLLFPTQNAVKTYVDTNITSINASNTALQSTVTANATATTAALALKEDAINKSTTTTLGTSNVLFPTQNAVKTYVDTNISTSNTANTVAITTLGNTVTSNATATTTALALKEDAINKSTTTTLGTSDLLFPTQNAVKTYVDTNISTSNTANTVAITTLGNTVTSNATASTTALALKEDAINKSTTTTLGTSNILFPTQNAVKTYVDTNISTSNTANTAAITTLGNTVTSNATATTAALTLKEDAINKSTTTSLGTSNVLFPTQNAVKTYVDTNISASNTANTVAITTLGNTVTSNATTTTAALALKEDAINKSTTTTLGTSNILFPTQNAVKTYVDTNISTSNTANTVAITTLGNTVTSNATASTTALALKEDAINKSTTTTLGTSDLLFPTQNAVKTYVDSQISSATIVDADATTKGKIQLAGDLGGTAAAPTVPGLALKAPIASPTFTGTVTSPVYASAPQALTDSATIVWNPTNGLNASVTLGGNRTLSFSSTPAVGTYGTLVVTQDATGNRTITLPSTTNKVLGSASTTTITLSSAANAKDILNFYYDGTNCYWNIGQGYGTAATTVSTNLTSAVTGTLTVANGGTGATTKTTAFDALSPMTTSGDIIYGGTSGTGTRLAKGSDGSLLTLKDGLPTWLTSIRATAGSSYNDAVGFSFIGGDWARNTGMFSDNPDSGGAATLKFRIATSNSTANSYLEINPSKVSVLSTAASTSKTTGALTVAGGLGVNGDLFATNLNASGTLAAGTVTYPNAHGTANQVLSTTGSGTLAWVTPVSSAASLTGTLAVANGGTGQTTIAGIQTALGLAGSKVAIGNTAGQTSQGPNAVSIGNEAGKTTQGQYAVAVGGAAGTSTQGTGAIAIGYAAGQTSQGANSVAIGSNAAQSGQGTQSVAIGFAANSTGNNAIGIGAYSSAAGNNSTAIGYKAETTAANTIQLGGDGVVTGSTAIANVKTTGTLTAGTVTYPNAHNATAGQLLSINATGTAAWTTPASSGGTHTIGESYGGGIVFYVWDGGAHGLIASSANLTGKYWGTDGTLVSSSVYPLRDGIGAGRNNTERIIQNIKSSDILFKSDYTLYAAYACLTLQDGNYGDWYLPSKYELSLLYLQKTLLSMTGVYWSSNDGATRDAWCHNFDSGTTFLNTKNYFQVNARPIRSF